MLIFSLFTLICYGSLSSDSLSNSSFVSFTKHLIRLGLISILFSVIYLYGFVSIPSDSYITLFNSFFNLNYINFVLSSLIYLISFVFLSLYAFNFSNNIFLNKFVILNSIEVLFLVFFNVIALLLFIMVSNLISFFIVLELQSYSIYLITSINNRSFNSVKSGLLYFLIGSLASSLILLGIGLIYYLTGSTYFENIAILFYYLINSGSTIIVDNYLSTIFNFLVNSNLNSLNLIGSSINLWTILLSFVFIFFGLSLKMGLSPHHNWSIYVYCNTPTVITYYISIIIKISILALLVNLIKVFTNIGINNTYVLDLFYNYNDLFTNIFNINLFKFNIIIISVIILSLLFGSISGLQQIKIKSLLAYSGVLNIGYVLITLLNINNSLNITSFIFFLGQYTITHINIFLIILIIPTYLIYNNKGLNNNSNKSFYTINNPYSPIEYIGQLSNLVSLDLYVGLSLIICLFSLIGIPPLFGFYGKYFVLISSLSSGFYWLTFLLIFASVISTIYYSYIIKVIILPKTANTLNTLSNNQISLFNKKFNNTNNVLENKSYFISYIISTLTLFILLNILVIENIIELLLC